MNILPSGLVIEYEYSEKQTLIKEWNNSGKEYSFYYDNVYNIIKGEAKIDKNTKLTLNHTHDRKGRITSIIDPNRNVETYNYETKFNKPTIYQTAEKEHIWTSYIRNSELFESSTNVAGWERNAKLHFNKLLESNPEF